MFELQRQLAKYNRETQQCYRLGMFELQLKSLENKIKKGINVIAWACLSCNPIPQVKLRKASVLRVCSRPPIVQNCWGVDGKSCNKNMSK